jgi:hypothetical protein
MPRNHNPETLRELTAKFLQGANNNNADQDNGNATVYGWFMEEFDTRDLKAAKALLDALAE